MAALPLPPIIKEQWVQCENANCNKWRKLPRGAPEVEEDEPWYCYMHPDPQRATCSAAEEEYNEATEITLPPAASEAEEAAHNAMIRERLAASFIATSSLAAAVQSGGRGRGGTSSSGGKGRGRGRGRRGRPPLSGRSSGRAAAAADFAAFPSAAAFGSAAAQRAVSFEDGIDEAFGDAAEGYLPSGRPSRRQASKHFQRLLDQQGSWEALRGAARSGGPPPPLVPPPQEVWEALAAAAPEAAEAACTAVDSASAARAFENLGAAAVERAQEADAMARCMLMVAAAAALGLEPEEGSIEAAAAPEAAREAEEPPGAHAVEQQQQLNGQPAWLPQQPATLQPGLQQQQLSPGLQLPQQQQFGAWPPAAQLPLTMQQQNGV